MKAKFFTLILFLFAISWNAGAQAPKRHKIALFIPLYLDSAFGALDTYRYNTSFPKYLNPGIEFYQGAQAALDSLNRAGAPLEAFVYDTRSSKTPLAQQLAAPELTDVELMIGHASAPEARLLAEAADRKNVPFISATLPNDAGVTGNPYYVILNSTLRAHFEGIYKYLQKFHRADKITFFTKPGTQEAQLKDFMLDVAKASGPASLRLNFVDLDNAVSASLITQSLDSTRKNICIAGSLDQGFGMQLAQQLSSARHTYPVTLFGMPTWDGYNFNRPELKNLEVIYTTPFYYARTTSLGNRLTEAFMDRQAGRPTDMFFRGYESTLRFALLLLDSKKDIAANLSRKGNTVFTPFDIQPVFQNSDKMELDYFENKKLYFIRVLNGVKNVNNF